MVRAVLAMVVLGATVQSLDRGAIDSAVNGAADVFAAEYFDVSVSASVSAEIRHRLQAGQYSTLQSNQELADRLTRDLFDLTNDKHVAVRARRIEGGGNKPSQRRDVPSVAGFRRTEILPGNVGLLDMAFFLRPVEHRDALEAAMKQLRDADALILDMRANSGGSPGTVALLMSYLFDEPGRPLFEIRPRSGAVDAYVTELVSLGLQNSRRPVYVLTSGQSFSGGEGLAFVLQDMKRAIVIGEKTVGAANPGRWYDIDGSFEIQVPNGQLLTSSSRRNWEGVGVTPDVAVPAADALRVAHLRAVDDVLVGLPPGEKREALARARVRIAGQ